MAWWNDELDVLPKRARPMFDQARNTKNLSEATAAKAAQRRYGDAVSYTKIDSWQDGTCTVHT